MSVFKLGFQIVYNLVPLRFFQPMLFGYPFCNIFLHFLFSPKLYFSNLELQGRRPLSLFLSVPLRVSLAPLLPPPRRIYQYPFWLGLIPYLVFAVLSRVRESHLLSLRFSQPTHTRSFRYFDAEEL